ncbi:Mlo-related protein [Cynara cardunculus var. scolymus]|uniref:Mlo-related protein n=1 Tax=Cynara cardunculus var. scolymus TaxID=59895 RepID=A0A103YEM8_CYNCS|nr:Mlo-related protein [Cynara cardunculus var. scolymus]
MATGSSSERSLEQTPTWAVALVCAWFQKKQKKAMLEALEKIKAGFLSLLLTVGTKYVAKICVPDSIGYKMLPCKAEHYDDDDDGKKKDGGKGGDGGDGDDEHRRKLLFLAEDGMVPMISYSAVHQLHIFIFILAVFHILYSVIIIVLGLAKAHFAPNSKFDFHKYIKRSMEDDFKFVLGIRMACTHLSLVRPTTVGTKLELVIMEMAQQIQDKATINAFQMAFFLWTVYEFGINSCYHESILAIGIRVGLGVLLHVMCSYITFPLYALVTQMGSHMKRSIFEEQTSKALKKWQKAAKERRRLRELGDSGGRPDTSNSGIMSMENTPSRGSSPVHFLHNNKHRSSTAESEIDIPSSPRAFPSETELSDTEGPYHARDQHKNLHPNFSFPKS